MRTILTITEQKQFLHSNWQLATITHKWSSRGYGNSKIIDKRGDQLAKATGCGYDRFGAAIGEAIQYLFHLELNKLGKRECRGTSHTRKASKKYYGLFYNAATQTAYLDGACGSSCMMKILNKIGFELTQVAETERSNTGEVFYTLEPISAHARKYH